MKLCFYVFMFLLIKLYLSIILLEYCEIQRLVVEKIDKSIKKFLLPMEDKIV